MPAHGLWSLLLFSSSILIALASKNKTNALGDWRWTSPWTFMRSKDIYLNLTTLHWPHIKCIRAKPTLKNKTAQTLSQDIFINVAIGENITWHIMKASYTPLFDEISNITRRARKFASVDEDAQAVTNYTFLHVIRDCAIVFKEKEKNKTGVVSSWELWVNNRFNTSSEACKKQYLKVCECVQPMQFNMSDCKRQPHNQKSF
uniref:Putative lipocalin n=1 Tax=Rhipicephalus microplus TaxID=6941 RepID=A0A6M2D6R4_RHIMP